MFFCCPASLRKKSGVHQLRLVGYPLSHYLRCFIHPRWLFGISSVNSSFRNYGVSSLNGIQKRGTFSLIRVLETMVSSESIFPLRASFKVKTTRKTGSMNQLQEHVISVRNLRFQIKQHTPNKNRVVTFTIHCLEIFPEKQRCQKKVSRKC